MVIRADRSTVWLDETNVFLIIKQSDVVCPRSKPFRQRGRLMKIDHPERRSTMSHRSLMALAASVVIGIGCISMISTDAFARGGRGGAGVGRAGAGVHHAGVGRVGVDRVGVAPVRRGVAVGVGAAAVGAAAAGAYGAYGAYQCGYAPYPPCY